MMKRILITLFVVFSFVTVSNAQSHAYVYISPDYGGCTGKLMIIPICIDLPHPVVYSIQVGSATYTSAGPWIYSNLCSGNVQFTLTAVDGLGNSHTLLSGMANLNTSSPGVVYGVQTISSPLTIVHQYQPSGPVCNGSSTFAITGGYPPYLYNLMDAGNNPVPLIPTPPNSYVANNLCPASYTFTIADNFTNSNCSMGTNPVAFPFSINIFDCFIATTDLSCAGNCNGTAQLVPIGDMNIAGMFMSGPSGSGTSSLSNQCPGVVTGTVIHTSGQQATCTNQITEPPPLNVTVNTSDCSGFGINDGTAAAIVSGGTPGYTYLWNTGNIQSFEDSLPAGIACVVVTDANGCDTMVCANIEEPPQLIIQINNVAHQTTSTPNGSVTYNITGGVAPYVAKLIRYAQNDTVTSTFSNLVAGNYAVYVTDANNISASQQFTINNNIPSGLAQHSSNMVAKLYPNPAMQQISIEAPEISLIEVYHISGQKVMEQKVNQENKIQLDITELPSGSYFVRIVSIYNQKTLPFIKQ